MYRTNSVPIPNTQALKDTSDMKFLGKYHFGIMKVVEYSICQRVTPWKTTREHKGTQGNTRAKDNPRLEILPILKLKII